MSVILFQTESVQILVVFELCIFIIWGRGGGMTMTIIPSYVPYSVLGPVSFSRQSYNNIVNYNIKCKVLPFISKHRNICNEL